MYRQHENPYTLEDQLEELLAEYDAAQDDDERMGLAESIAELRDRINFAWQDDEEE